MKNTNVWKLRDAEARFSEVVRRARGGASQKITVRGREALIVMNRPATAGLHLTKIRFAATF